MITIPFDTAIALLISCTLLLVYLHWLFYNYYRRDEAETDSSYYRQCPYCAYIYFDYEKEKLTVCPRCHSFISPDEKNG